MKNLMEMAFALIFLFFFLVTSKRRGLREDTGEINMDTHYVNFFPAFYPVYMSYLVYVPITVYTILFMPFHDFFQRFHL